MFNSEGCNHNKSTLLESFDSSNRRSYFSNHYSDNCALFALWKDRGRGICWFYTTKPAYWQLLNCRRCNHNKSTLKESFDSSNWKFNFSNHYSDNYALSALCKDRGRSLCYFYTTKPACWQLYYNWPVGHLAVVSKSSLINKFIYKKGIKNWNGYS